MYYDDLFDYLNFKKIEYDKKIITAKLNSYEIGGDADAIIVPSSLEEFCDVLSFLHSKKPLKTKMRIKSLWQLVWRR